MLNAAWSIFTPREPIRTLDWARNFVFTDGGEPYNDFAYPHIGAPGGPLDALDCREIRKIWLQWGTRLGKSFLGQVGSMKTAHCEPSPMMLVSADRKLAGEVLERTVNMIERCPPLREQLPPKHLRKADLLRLALSKLYVAWARSPATLADKQIKFGHGNEIDKWEHLKTSKEGDPQELFLDRFKDVPMHKVLLEGSPALKHSSRVERGRLASCNAYLWVECQRCRRYQTLRMGNGKDAGGIVWDRPPGGRSDRELARQTARYICEHCKKENHDRDRGPMMRSGVWIPEGCGCDDKKARKAAQRQREEDRPPWTGWSDSDWITGTPLRDGPEYGSQLSSLYALSLTWGEIAAKFVHVHERPHLLRGFVNGWEARTWELVKNQENWETLGRRLIFREGPLAVGRGIVPKGYALLTAGCDKQQDHYVIHVDAWGAGGRQHTVDYATVDTDDELLAWLGKPYQLAAGGHKQIALSLLDSGSRPKGVYALCARAKKIGIALLPCKGSSTAMGTVYKKTRLGENTAAPGQPLVMVDTVTTQDWVERVLHEIQPGDAGGMSIYAAAVEQHRDYLEQLLNDAPVEELDSRNLARESWQRIDDTIPNDLRDGKRYSYVAMLLRNRGKEISDTSPAEGQQPAKKKRKPRPRPQTHTPLRRPGGWLSRP